MLSRTGEERIHLQAGAKGSIELEVTNLRDVIDGISPRVHGLNPAFYSIPVPYVSVFPDAAETIRVNVELPRSFTTGEHEIVIELRSTVDGEARIEHPLTLVVEPLEEISLKLRPKAARAGSKIEFDAELVNTGNTTIDLLVDGADAERAINVETDPIFVRAPNGATTTTKVMAKGRRPFYGSPVQRTITVTAENSNHQLVDVFQLTQKPRVPAGLGTTVTLAAIITLWAVVFMWAISNIFATSAGLKALGEGFAADGPGSLDIAGVNGTIDGRVVSVDGVGIPRLTVSALRVGGDGSPIASGATDEDGLYSIPLLPGSYFVQVSGRGFETRLLTAAQSGDKPMEIKVDPSASMPVDDIQIAGAAGSVEGQIVAVGLDDTTAPQFELKIRKVVDGLPEDEFLPQGDASQPDETGVFAITGLPTPADYELQLSATGFGAQRVLFSIESDNEPVILNTVTLLAGSAEIRGYVLAADGSALGNVTVKLNAGDVEMETTTPTTGDVGSYVFGGLASPQTYLLTFTLDGYATEVVALEVGAGADTDAEDVTLFAGTGVIGGTVTASDGTPLGGVTVTALGAAGTFEVQSLTDEPAGSYRVSGLATPGEYAVTFSLEGYVSTTRRIALGPRESEPAFDVELGEALARISGRAFIGTVGQDGVTVTLSDGSTTRETVTIDGDVETIGQYVFDGVAAGTYTITFDNEGQMYVLLLGNVEGGDDIDDANAVWAVVPS